MQSPRKIAVAGATGRVGRHTVDVLRERGHDVVPMSRSQGVDVITGDGLAAALAGVDCVIDAARRALARAAGGHHIFHHRGGEPAPGRPADGREPDDRGVHHRHRPVHRRLRRPRRSLMRRPTCPARSRRGCCAPRSSTSWSGNWWTGAPGATWPTYRRMRTQLVAARAVAEVLADLATEPVPAGASFTEVAGPREESLVEMARLLAARRGYPPRRSRTSATRLTQTASSTRTVPCFPAPAPSSPAPPLPSGWTQHPGQPRPAAASPELHQPSHREEAENESPARRRIRRHRDAADPPAACGRP